MKKFAMQKQYILEEKEKSCALRAGSLPRASLKCARFAGTRLFMTNMCAVRAKSHFRHKIQIFSLLAGDKNFATDKILLLGFVLF
jgi:hypothetical protein